MDENEFLASKFEANRKHLKKIAFRMLGSLTEAEDAVQETWLRLSGAKASEILNLAGWLTTVIGRVCLDVLRLRKSHREEDLDPEIAEPVAGMEDDGDPEESIALADSVGLALLVVLENLRPSERVAFVLHDIFDLPFNQIAPIVGRSPAAARKLAARARVRVRGAPKVSDPNTARRKRVVDAYLAAARDGDFEGLLAVLDPIEDDRVIEIDVVVDPGRLKGLELAIL